MKRPSLIKKEGTPGNEKIVLVDKCWFQLDDETDRRFVWQIVQVMVAGKKVTATHNEFSMLTRDKQREAAGGWYSRECCSRELSEHLGLPCECLTIIILHPVNGESAFWAYLGV